MFFSLFLAKGSWTSCGRWKYILTQQLKSWEGAKIHCQQIQTKGTKTWLAAPKTQEEQYCHRKFSQGLTWIGVHRSNTSFLFRYLDGAKFDYNVWRNEDLNTNGSCLAILGKNQTFWTTENCSRPLKFVCQIGKLCL